MGRRQFWNAAGSSLAGAPPSRLGRSSVALNSARILHSSFWSSFPFLTSSLSTQQPDSRAALVAQLVKNLPDVQETWVWSLGWEDPLEKRMATHCSILSWRIPWRQEPGGLQFMGSQRVRDDWMTNSLTLGSKRREAPWPLLLSSSLSSSVQA